MRAVPVHTSPAGWGLGLAIGLALLVPAGAARGGVASIPGALPAGFRYEYADSFHGWPVAPIHREHPVRGGFLAPRKGGYHFGIDIAVDDRHPDPGAPPHRSHRVYALDSGVVHIVKDAPRSACQTRRLDIGHFSYWHVDATLPQGGRVRAGAPIGWTCTGEWHVHLSEWQWLNGTRVWVNPLHRHGKLAPYVDTSPPVIGDVRFANADGTALHRWALSGSVDVFARVADPQSFLGWLRDDPRWVLPDPPYRLAATIRDRSGRVVVHRVAFQADQLPRTPYSVFYARPTRADLFIPQCRRSTCRASERPHWFRPLSRHTRELWNTRLVAPGLYTITVTAWDARGNAASKTVTVDVIPIDVTRRPPSR